MCFCRVAVSFIVIPVALCTIVDLSAAKYTIARSALVSGELLRVDCAEKSVSSSNLLFFRPIIYKLFELLLKLVSVV